MSKKRKTPPAPRGHDATGFILDEPTVTRPTRTLVEWAVDSSAREVDDLATEPVPALPPRAEVEPSVVVEGDAEDELRERRLTATLLRMFARRRLQIRLSLDQLARLSGISHAQLEAFEEARPGQTISYDQTVVLARVLGVPSDELPGLRRRDRRAHLSVTLSELETSMMAAPLLRFEGKHGERFGGDVERAASSKAFTVRIEDDSLVPAFPRGSLLAFLNGTRPRVGGVLLLRHLRSSLLALRRFEPPSYAGLAAWQPGYVVGGEWHVVGCVEAVLLAR